MVGPVRWPHGTFGTVGREYRCVGPGFQPQLRGLLHPTEGTVQTDTFVLVISDHLALAGFFCPHYREGMLLLPEREEGRGLGVLGSSSMVLQCYRCTPGPETTLKTLCSTLPPGLLLPERFSLQGVLIFLKSSPCRRDSRCSFALQHKNCDIRLCLTEGLPAGWLVLYPLGWVAAAALVAPLPPLPEGCWLHFSPTFFRAPPSVSQTQKCADGAGLSFRFSPKCSSPLLRPVLVDFPPPGAKGQTQERMRFEREGPWLCEDGIEGRKNWPPAIQLAGDPHLSCTSFACQRASPESIQDSQG